MKTSSSSSSASTLKRNYTQPVQGLQDKQKLETLLNSFFQKQNISNVMTEITGKFKTPGYSLTEGPRVLPGGGQPTKFEILYRPTMNPAGKCPNHFVDKALEIALREAGYEVEVGKADDQSPHLRSMTVTINDYILDAIKTRKQNQVLKGELERNVAELEKEKVTNRTLKQRATQGSEAVGLLKSNIRRLDAQNQQLKSALASKQNEYLNDKRKLQETNTKLNAQNRSLNDSLKYKGIQNQNLNHTLKETEQFLIEQRTGKQTLSKQLQENSTRNEALKKQNQQLKSALASKQTENKSALNKELEDKQYLKKNLQKHSAELQEVTQQNKTLKNKLQSMTKENKSLEEKVAQNQQLKSALASKQTEKETLQKHLAELQKVKDQNQILKDNIAHIQKQNEFLNNTLIEREKESFNKIKENENSLQKKNNQLMIELKKKQFQNKKLKKDIQEKNTLYVSSLPLQKKNMELTDENTKLKNQNQRLKENFLKTVRKLNQEVNSAIEKSKTAPSAY